MTGYVANFHSTIKNMAIITAPKTIRQVTVAEAHGKETPPKVRPKRNVTVPPTMRRDPSQSMALMPARKGVLGVAMSRKKRSTANARPSHGTARQN